MKGLATIFWLICFAATAQVRNAPFLGVGRQGLITEWSQRVVANGGALPSAATIAAMETFRLGIISDGLSNKMIAVCIFVPDSLIAATTPLIQWQGYPIWTNHNFVSGDLTVDGLKGDGSSKYLDTGVHPTSGGAFNSVTKNVGLSVIVTDVGGNASSQTLEIGAYSSANASLLWLSVSGTGGGLGAGTTSFYTADSSNNSSTRTNDFGRCGFVSGNSVSNICAIYAQSPLISQKVLATNSIASVVATTNMNLYVFANGNVDFVADSYSFRRLSVAAIHNGLTAAEAALFAARLFTLRAALGGGTGDEVTDWSYKVVRYGGAAPSAATKAALQTAYASLDTSGVLDKSVAMNFLVPDNLTAASIPIVWKAGGELWTNFLFGATNLSVNGLTGNGTNKYFNTGIKPSTVPANTGFAVTSAGISLMVVTNGVTDDRDFGATDAQASSLFSLETTGSGAQNLFYCWKYATLNSDFVTAPGLATGFLSGQRTAANAIAIYGANSGSTFHTITNATGTGAGQITTTAIAAFALNFNGTITGYSRHTVSFLGLTAGLTSVQASNLYYIVSTARTALGGGNP